ncbi:unnamed protein product [Rhizophagus irregularis]|nr:unnamed protein product [Rhizophagus irregularis]
MPVETTHRTLDNKVLPDETSFVIIKKLRFVSGKRRERGKTKGKGIRFGVSGGLPNNGKTQRFTFCVSGGLPKNGNPKIRSGGLPKNENQKIRTFVRVGFRRTKTKRFVLSFGWASEERKPKDSYFLSGGLPKNENPKIRSGGLPKNEDSRSDRLPCSEEREIPRFDRVGFRPSGKEEPRFDRVGFRPSGKEEPRFASGGLPTFGKRGTKIRKFGWIAKE